MANHVVVYQDAASEWRWRFVSGNNKIMADSSEGYVNKADCLGSLEEVLNGYITQVPTAIQDEAAPVATALVSAESFLPVVFE